MNIIPVYIILAVLNFVPVPLRPAYHDSLLCWTAIPFWGRTKATAQYKARKR